MKPACSECRFFAASKTLSCYGECRRHPPVPRLTYEGRHDELGGGVWPPVLPDEWCGHFVRGGNIGPQGPTLAHVRGKALGATAPSPNVTSPHAATR